jgi:hypothetical protein
MQEHSGIRDISKKIQNANVPAFDGEDVTLGKTFVLRSANEM